MTEEEKKAAAEKEAADAAKAKEEADKKAAEEAAEKEKNGEKTMGEVLETGKKPEEKTNHIPEAAFLDEKKGRKAAEARVKELEELIKSGGSKTEITAEIEAIAKKHNVDSGFLRDLTASIEAGLRTGMAQEVEEKLKPLNERDRQERIGKVFEEHFTSAMERMPEFKGVVNKEVIKTLSLDPKNANKTFTQIIEETYGAAVPGKRSIEQNKPGGGKEPGEIDFDRAKRDTAYFNEIMADPASKKKYNEGLTGRISAHL